MSVKNRLNSGLSKKTNSTARKRNNIEYAHQLLNTIEDFWFLGGQTGVAQPSIATPNPSQKPPNSIPVAQPKRDPLSGLKSLATNVGLNLNTLTKDEIINYLEPFVGKTLSNNNNNTIDDSDKINFIVNHLLRSDIFLDLKNKYQFDVVNGTLRKLRGGRRRKSRKSRK
jgi:hypothetical protein